MKKILFVALLGLMTAITAMAAIDNTPVSMTIILKNGNTVSYAASNMDSVRFVGGKFGDNGAIGMKIYLKGQTHSVDYLYSQITDVVEDTQPVVPSNTFIRVTSASQLVAGKRYILVYEGTPAVMGAISNTSTKYGLSILENGNFDYEDGVVQLTEETGVKVLTLGGSEGAWTFELDGSTLCWKSGNSLETGDSGNEWTITIDEDNNAIISNKSDLSRRILYNKTSPRFACYAPGGQTGTYSGQSIHLYVEDDGSAASVVAAPTFSPNGGLINTSTQVTIHCDTEGASIYYTTDGTRPSASNGTLYDGAITVNATTTIKAIAIKDGESSTVTSVTFTYTDGPITDNNVNRNSLSAHYMTNKKMWSLEWPRINETDNNSWVMKSTSDYGVTFSLEWSNSKIANRWTCYTMHDGNNDSRTGRNDSFKEDPELPSSSRSTLNDYSGSGYSRGHLCPSSDRLCSEEQNKQTFYLSNMQPQWQSHNSGIWSRLETQIQKWGGYKINNITYQIISDTLYVVKAATIADVSINGTTSSGVYSQLCNDRLPVPKYFYAAVLARTGETYKAIALWTQHTDDAQTNTSLASCVISIDELERRTGIDFFCNLPDDIEDAVESASPDLSFWNLTNN